MWERLREIFAAKGLGGIVGLWKQFHRLKMDDGVSMSDHIAEARSIADLLGRRYGDKPSLMLKSSPPYSLHFCLFISILFRHSIIFQLVRLSLSVNNPLFILIRAGAIVSAINRVPNGTFAPVIEGPNGFLPDLPSRLITAGKINNAEFVGGHCTGDGKSFAGGSPDNFQTDDDIRQRVFSRRPGVSNTTIDRALAIYPEPNAPRKSIRDSVRPRINHG
ncbi:hypothetical protein B0H13DRAFT_2322025 [Mycena leptocephala]|nr:hypothetical protein B0H13DRAFT_2322025 [Mycena leptocephala]